MSGIEKFKTLLLTAAAAAAVQSCADGAAELLEPLSAPPSTGLAKLDEACPHGTSEVQVGADTHCRLSGVIDEDVHLDPGRIYQLAGIVQFGVDRDALGAGPTLTIAPGATIYAADKSSVLLIARGAAIEAVGDDAAPIVFTSAYDLGFDDELGLKPRTNIAAPRGEWGGIVVLGLGDVSGVSGVSGAVCAHGFEDAPSFCAKPNGVGGGLYGGALGAADASAAIAHVHIRFAGAYAADSGAGHQRVPALSLKAVGAASMVKHVTVTNAFGDGVRLLGGDVALDDVAVIGAGDDGVEWGEGYQGALRNVVVAHDARLGDGDNGFEGRSEDVAAVSTPERPARPRVSNPLLENVVALGDAKVSNAGLALLDGTDARVRGATLAGAFSRAGLDVDGAQTYRLLSSEDLSGIVVTAKGGLSQDFDDAGLAAFFAAGAGNAVKSAPLALADALSEARARAAATSASPENPALVAAPEPLRTFARIVDPAPLANEAVLSAAIERLAPLEPVSGETAPIALSSANVARPSGS